MRIERLVVQGFASFRERAELTFEGVDLFALTGPTGAGKSSILDAMGFALYGCVSRYDDSRLVAPAICQGALEARVQLDFSIGGRNYTAVRIARRTPAGASTSEARLESNGTVIAASARELTEAIEKDVIGLTFEQFTTCVMLPQGDFAEFLHARGKTRQDLLVRLLDIELFRQVQRAAGARASAAEAGCVALSGRLNGDLADATADAVEAARSRAADLAALVERLANEQAELDRLKAMEGEQRRAAETAQRNVALLAGIEVPDGAADLGDRLASATAAAETAKRAVEEARAVTLRARDALRELPARDALVLLQADHAEMVRLSSELKSARQDQEKLARAWNEARGVEEESRHALQAAETRRDELLRADSAYHASLSLEVGQDCPICGKVLETAPTLDPPAGLDDLDKDLEQLRAVALEAKAETSRLEKEQAARDSHINTLGDAKRTIDERLAGKPSADEVEARLAAIRGAEIELAAAEAAEQEALEAEKTAVAELEDVGTEEQDAWPAYNTANRSLADLAPPLARMGDLAGSWVDLRAWATQLAEAEQGRANDAGRAMERASADRQEFLRQQTAACDELHIDVGENLPHVAAATAKGAAEQELQHVEAQKAERDEIQKKLALAQGRAKLARTLADALRTDRFERWYLSEALRRLAMAGSTILGELSGGAYALALNDAGDDFEVIDYFNAGERRSVRTLSGGETFLASLSLALALSEEVAGMAATGARRLEALFLDEGFGTLDADTLEIVASAIEELGARGRMVGIVTHVRELAARVPVQFQVRKEAGSSRVTPVYV